VPHRLGRTHKIKTDDLRVGHYLFDSFGRRSRVVKVTQFKHVVRTILACGMTTEGN
jgi:hypothetical protein